MSLNRVTQVTPTILLSKFKQIYTSDPRASKDSLGRAFYLNQVYKIRPNLHLTVKQGILGVHPDLAGRLAQQGGLTDESLKEQRSAGLMANMEGEKKREICELNER